MACLAKCGKAQDEIQLAGGLKTQGILIAQKWHQTISPKMASNNQNKKRLKMD